MFAKLHVSVTPRRDVEVSLDSVRVKAAVDTARVRHAPIPRSLGELPRLARAQIVVHVFLLVSLLSLAALKLVNLLVLLGPLLPARVVLGQRNASENAVARGVLDIDVQVPTAHGHHNVQVDLHFVSDSLLDAERVRRVAYPPPLSLRDREPYACYYQEECPVCALGSLLEVRLLRFGCKAGLVA